MDAPFDTFEKAAPTRLEDIDDATAQMVADHMGVSLEEGRRMAFEQIGAEDVYLNSRYQVSVRYAETGEGWPEMLHLSIKRRDREVIHDWRDLQRIKNALVGEEHEAVELYPAESRLTDTANQYHLWVLTDPGVRFPFGFQDRLTWGESRGAAKQRAFDTG